ncbi:hypothetical protein V3C99_013095, partial [Haemonchus contortus]|uniref:DUF1534 domain-containing protein n=1 Tax=Haemonchus contortus TaxID=6289 RepID=A0A7I4Y1L5_HAECO
MARTLGKINRAHMSSTEPRSERNWATNRTNLSHPRIVERFRTSCKNSWPATAHRQIIGSGA